MIIIMLLYVTIVAVMVMVTVAMCNCYDSYNSAITYCDCNNAIVAFAGCDQCQLDTKGK